MGWDNIRQFFGAPRRSHWNALPTPKRGVRRRALIIGCVADAHAMQKVLARHAPGANGGHLENFECELLVSGRGNELITAKLIKKKWLDLFEDPDGTKQKFDGDVLFYFSGHGAVNPYGGHLVTQDVDANEDDLGFEMENLILLANRHSAANSVTIIIDACNSGVAGEPPDEENVVKIIKGISILTASLPDEFAMEIDGRGVFTQLVVSALEGGAADVLGNVSPASIFAYAEAALGPQEQRPMYKTHASDWEIIRRVKPEVSTEELQRLPEFFSDSSQEYPFDPEFEHTELEKFDRGEPSAIVTNADGSISNARREEIKEKIKIFKLFKRYQVVGLLEPNKEQLARHKPGNENDLYWAALCSTPVQLTRLGHYYRQLAAKGLITG
jgi:Caspase domain